MVHGYVPPIERQLLYWATWAALVTVGLWGQRNSNKRLRAIDVSGGGLWFGGEGGVRSILVRWEQIDRVERFSYPDLDAIYMLKKGGIRLWAAEKSYLIYEHIHGFADLCEEIRRKLAERGITMPV